jgi:hypothetical protein
MNPERLVPIDLGVFRNNTHFVQLVHGRMHLLFGNGRTKLNFVSILVLESAAEDGYHSLCRRVAPNARCLGIVQSVRFIVSRLQIVRSRNITLEVKESELLDLFDCGRYVSVLRLSLVFVALMLMQDDTATRKKFALHRQPHFLAVEDLGRFDDIDIIPLWGLYPTTLARVCVGDHRQLGVAKRSFHNPIKPSFLTRLSSNGSEVLDLRKTQRFGNEELHDLVRIINKDASIQVWKSALRD